MSVQERQLAISQDLTSQETEFPKETKYCLRITCLDQKGVKKKSKYTLLSQSFFRVTLAIFLVCCFLALKP